MDERTTMRLVGRIEKEIKQLKAMNKVVEEKNKVLSGMVRELHGYLVAILQRAGDVIILNKEDLSILNLYELKVELMESDLILSLYRPGEEKAQGEELSAN